MVDDQKIERVVKRLIASDLRVIRPGDVAGARGSRRWFALRTAPGKEQVAEVLMLQAGHLAFCPVEIVERKLNRFKRQREPRPRPMLTSMILAGFDADPPWFHVFRMNAILGVIGSGSAPVTIPHKAVLRMLRLSGSAAELRRPPFVVKVGLRTVITDGPFDGIAGKVMHCTDRRARLLLEIDGAQHELDVPVELLAEAS